MALFGTKKTTKGQEDTEASLKESSTKKTSFKDLRGRKSPRDIFLEPRITEKASFSSEEGGMYVFNVRKNATKKDIESALNTIYNVVPLKVRTARIPEKRVFVRGKRGVKSGGKKAYVYLKKGDSIEII